MSGDRQSEAELETDEVVAIAAFLLISGSESAGPYGAVAYAVPAHRTVEPRLGVNSSSDGEP